MIISGPLSYFEYLLRIYGDILILEVIKREHPARNNHRQKQELQSLRPGI